MNNVANFIERWTNRGDEKSDTQSFWIDLLTSVFNVQNVANFIFFEERVQLQHTSFIDATIPSTHTMIEQKSLHKDLSKPIKQSDGTFLTPYQQAKRYANELPYSKRPRWIVACNFAEFHVYDMEKFGNPEIILLKNLDKEFYRLKFLVDSHEYNLQRELQISLQAGEIVQKLYDSLLKNYLNPNDENSLQSLNKLCVRLVFCLYAESSGIFGDKNIFRNYLNQFPAKFLRKNLIELFKILDTKIENRDKYLDEDLNKFPYVNGNLFSDEIEIPNFNDEIKFFLLEYASRNFDWSGISPTIFGAVFESTLNPATRRIGGMHYTSIENIHKVIDNLFLNDLHNEFISCKKNKKKLLAFQDKISQLKFFDPACGSGNFLTESYISLRRLENNILKELLQDKILLGDFDNPIKVSINQFYGIEINDFAVSVAKTALWIAELQMLQETQNIIHKNLQLLPLKNFANIFEGNALTLDWKKLCPNPDFIFGNPPFVGASMMNSQQKIDATSIFGKIKLSNSIDYVGAWYHKAAKLMQNSNIKAAFVSTNSITQGEQVAPLWNKILFDYNMQIIFAYKTFRWDSESSDKAHVHCVIIAFADKFFSNQDKFIFDDNSKILAKNINPYLFDAPDILIQSRSNPLQNFIPKMTRGNQATDDGNFIFSQNEAEIFSKKYPQHKKFLRRYLGAKDFLHGKPIRFCLWLKDVPPNEFANNREIMRRLENIKIFRKKSSAAPTRKAAETPYLFFSAPQTNSTCIVIPRVSSERRIYLPIDFISSEIIASDSVQIIPDANLFLFGVISSSVHMAWIKSVAGRLKSDFRYSGSIVYNSFPFPEKDFEKISATAQNILQVRKNYPSASLADLYDPILMPKDLHDAHKKNDLAVLEAYGFDKNFSESEIVAELMKLYKNLTSAE